MTSSNRSNAANATRSTPAYLLFGSAGLAGRQRPDELVDLFHTEAAAREAFRRLRLEVGSGPGWAELIALDEGVVRPLCWFGLPAAQRNAPGTGVQAPKRPPRRSIRRWLYGAMGLAMGTALWLVTASPERAGAAVAPHVSRSGLLTVGGGQRVEATATNDSDACHRVEIHMVDGEGRSVASEGAVVCPTLHLSVAYHPGTKVWLRSTVVMYGVTGSIADPSTHTFEVQDALTGVASIVVSKP